MNQRLSLFSRNIIKIVKSIPEGKILSYGEIATLAGNPRGARGVAWFLSSSSKKYDLPWHRVLNKKGEISLKCDDGEIQKILLEAEGIKFDGMKIINPELYRWVVR